MSFKTASAILRGQWLIEPIYAKAQLPLILQMISRQAETGGDHAGRDFTQATKDEPVRIQALGASRGIYRMGPYSSMDSLPDDSIVLVDIIGPVLKYGDYCSCGTVHYNDLVNRLSNSNKVKGILLNIDSPGGQVDGTATLANTIREATKVKPVLGIIQNGMAASAAMWIGSACQELYVSQPTDQVGSIGAYCTIYDFAGYFKANGVVIHEVYAPQSGDKNKGYKDALEGDYALLQADLKFIVDCFIKEVKTNRGERLNIANENPFTGKLYKAADATKIGLIDGLKSIASVLKRMEQIISGSTTTGAANSITKVTVGSNLTKETPKTIAAGEMEFQKRLYDLLK